MNLKLKHLHELDLLDAKEMVRIYDCKTDKVAYGIGRWENVVCDDELFDSLGDRSICYLGAECDDGVSYLNVYLSDSD